ncbi:MAG: PspA/IM30 family protein [Proteobacteria bacterium]|nr:PspA/IM30 family protein [Pseudomonadota bacterium]
MLSRFVRIWKADIHGVMDEFEDRGLVLKQSLRDMEDELERKEMHLKQLEASRDQAVRRYDGSAERYGKLERDLESGLAGGHDAICLALIRRMKEEEKLMGILEGQRQEMEREMVKRREILGSQHSQYQEFLARAREYFLKEEQQNWQDTFAGNGVDYFSTPATVVTDEEVAIELIRRKTAMELKEGKK